MHSGQFSSNDPYVGRYSSGSQTGFDCVLQGNYPGYRIINRLSVDKTTASLPAEAASRLVCHALIQHLPDDALVEAAGSLFSIWQGWHDNLRNAQLHAESGFGALPPIRGRTAATVDAVFEFDPD